MGTSLRELIIKAARQLRPYLHEFEAIAVRGHSGHLVGPAVAALLGKDVISVRKRVEVSHSCCKVEGAVVDSYLILDDFMSSGDTVKDIIKNVKEWHPPSRLVGIYVYGQSWFNPENFTQFNCWGLDGLSGKFAPHPDTADQAA